MKPKSTPFTERTWSRRRFLQASVLVGAAPWIIEAPALGAKGKPSPSGKLTLGVIGVGEQGRSDLSGFLTHKDVQVTALCDINRKNLDAARRMVAQAYGRDDIRTYTDFRELNADPSIDAVLMALPVHWHSIPSLDAIRNGKHIYHEKPMGMSFDEASLVRDAVRKKGVVFQFGTQQRSDPKFRWACELARSGRLGKLKEIQVSVPAGKHGPAFPPQALPEYLDWNRWVGPSPMAPFHEAKLQRDNHENMSNFSLGMIACWGIHHLDIAQWGNNTDDTGPVAVQGTGEFPKEGAFDAVEHWRVRFDYATAAPVIFVHDGTEGFEHGIRFIGESAWVHVRRGMIQAQTEPFLSAPENQPAALPVRLPESADHIRNFIDAAKAGRRAICDINTAVRADTLCQIALIAVKMGRPLRWDPVAERFPKDDSANAMLRPRAFRDGWKLPDSV